ncbi:MAG: hydroxyisourate hydrolase [Acidobacteriota bacterium]
MSGITTHVLDTSRGRPAEGVPVRLDVRMDDGWRSLGSSLTDRDGRAQDLFTGDPPAGTYRLTFGAATYFSFCGVEGFYPVVEIVFEVRDPSQHYHVPLLLSPFGYSTYRGS